MEMREVPAEEMCVCAHQKERHRGLECLDCPSRERWHGFNRTHFMPKSGVFMEVFDENDVPREAKVKGGR